MQTKAILLSKVFCLVSLSFVLCCSACALFAPPGPAASRSREEEVLVEKKIRQLLSIGNGYLEAGDIRAAESAYSLLLEL